MFCNISTVDTSLRVPLRPSEAGRKHSLATHLIDGNVNLAVVKRALGHKSINSTMVYVTVSDRQAGEESRAALMHLY